MTIDPLLTSDILDVHYDEENAWLYLDWKGPQDLATVQAACGQLTAIIQQTNAHKALNDNTHITETSWELVEWVAQDYLARAATAGIEYVAWVRSPLLACCSNIEHMSAFSDSRPVVALFDNLAEAYEWLGSHATYAATNAR